MSGLELWQGDVFNDSSSDSENDLHTMEHTVIEDNEDGLPGVLDGSGEEGLRLGISDALARDNYVAAGEEVEEERDSITLEDNSHYITEEIDSILDNIVQDLSLPYKLADFQRVAVNVLGSQKNLILVSPTGSGKMNVPLLSVLVLREKMKNKKGLAIVTQPLTSIMNEKMVNKICDVAVLSMSGDLKTNTGAENPDLSCDLDDLLEGKFPVLLGHPESFDTPLGQMILRELQRKEMLLMVCVDEFHQGGEGHWSVFRPDMMKLSTSLRLYGVRGCPSVCMTATATEKEIEDVVKALGLRAPPVILTASPIQAHIKISIIRSPPTNYGLDGTVTKKGVRNPGLLDLLDRILLRKYVEDLKAGAEPKKAIIFCRGNGLLGSIYSHLMNLTEHSYKDCRDAPFVMNHSSLLPPTEKVIADRASDISLYLSSNKMLLGIDLPKIDIIIFIKPYNQVAALVQGGGRGGRKMENGMRRRVQVYQLFNSQDLTSQNKSMSEDMRRICKSKECTRLLLEKYFVGGKKDKSVLSSAKHCCHNCDIRLQESS